VHERDKVLTAAEARATALAAGDVTALRELLHPAFGWVSHRGDMFDREQYIAANTGPSGIRWRAQRLTDVDVVVVEETAVLRAVVTDIVISVAGEQRLRMPMTQTWVRDGGPWRCLAGHAGPRLD
jgi:hypothetical protein